MLGQQISPGDEIKLDGTSIENTIAQYILINKPVGYVCSRREQGKSPTIYDLLPNEFHPLKSVGRLDKDSSGLLLLTNDGQLAQRMTHPSYQKIKKYYAELNRPLSEQDKARIEAGVNLSDGVSHLKLDQKDQGWIVTMHEGRNRQIRRTFLALKYRVKKLDRISFGKLVLNGLAPGQFRLISLEEVK